MAKAKQERRLAENETRAFLKSAGTSAQKARLVLDQIRGKHVEKALAELTFSKKAVAKLIKKLLESAIANAENNHQLDIDNLYITTAFADKTLIMKRFRARARGRGVKILKPDCSVTLVVAEKTQSKEAA